MTGKHYSTLVVLMIVAAVVSTPAFAQEEILEEQIDLLEAIHEDHQDRELVVAPVPILNPTFGTGLAAA